MESLNRANPEKDRITLDKEKQALGNLLKELETNPANGNLYLEAAAVCDRLGLLDDANFFRQKAGEIESLESKTCVPNINTKDYWDAVFLSEIGKNQWRRYPVTFGKIKTYLGIRTKENDSILDIGCGYGVLLDQLGSLGCNRTGWDISEVAIDYIERKGYRGRCLDFALPWAIEKGRYTHVVATEFLEHTEKPETLIKKMYELAEETIIFTVPNHSLSNRECKEHLQCFDLESVGVLIEPLRLTRVYVEEYVEEFFYARNGRDIMAMKNPSILAILEK